MRQMWFGPSSVVSPREFKLVLGRHAPQFLGYSQHDSHELCNFVVDGARSHATRPRSSCRPTPPAQPMRGWLAVGIMAWPDRLLRDGV